MEKKIAHCYTLFTNENEHLLENPKCIRTFVVKKKKKKILLFLLEWKVKQDLHVSGNDGTSHIKHTLLDPSCS